MKYKVNHEVLSYEAEGARHHGPDTILLDHATDLTGGTNWSGRGFTIEPLFDPKLFDWFHLQAVRLLRALWVKSGLPEAKELDPMHYHHVADTPEKHLAAVEHTKQLHTKEFPVNIRLLETRISEVCGRRLRVMNPWDGQSIFHFRVVRPNRGDNNPLHRDVWLDDYDNCINLYIPVAGSNAKSSLIIYPGSHRWSESRVERTAAGAVITGTRFNVPAVTHIDGDPVPERPDPSLNEVLIFSPYLIHGGAVNLNHDLTRISIEVRLWAV